MRLTFLHRLLNELGSEGSTDTIGDLLDVYGVSHGVDRESLEELDGSF